MRKKALLLLPLLSVSLNAMTPPSLSVNVMPRSSASGLTGLSDDRSGVSLTLWQSTRSRLRAGTRPVDNPLHEKTETLRMTWIADHPLTPRWSAVAALPFVRSRSSFDGGGDETKGLGDAMILFKRVLSQNQDGPARRELQLLAGAELPTGKTDAKDAAGLNLPAPQQPGSKTVDLLAGVAGAANLRRASIYADALYKRAGARAYTFGDLFTLNLGVNRPFGPRARFSATVELNVEAAGRDKADLRLPGARLHPDGTVIDSGHETAFLTPGLQWRPSRRWTMSAAVQLPIHQNYRGVQLSTEANWVISLQGRWGRHAD